uniref:CRIB domain-containing protein n=1 Tax=Ditylenchus dipsaci TaxID=166011 RepID=A0A915DYZ6_9BILA
MHQMSLSNSATPNKVQPAKQQQQHKLNKESKKAKKGDKRPKHRKEDISNPTDFKHLAHVGWDQDGGFSRQVYNHEPLDDSVRDLLRAAGQNPDHFDNPEDIKFVYEFLEGGA